MRIKNGTFYMTRAINEELNQEHLHFIIKYLFEHSEQLTDYLQIFEFYTVNDQQWLLQRQEEPHRETVIPVQLIATEPINRKVWVMEQGDEGIMILFPEDY
ncbi:DUF960 family protein [Sporosarcina sp. FSL K6-5500]|uniref:DUF960 family protein n=1 Tax=Sporosarcina sp. FSL K6-5500 TaxID=2921558 RepID=UPI0030FCF6FB